jgi:ATP-dependent Zn protease
MPHSAPSQETPSPKPVDAGRRGPSSLLASLLAAAFVALWLFNAFTQSRHSNDVDYSTFYAFVAQGKVKSVVIEGQDIQGRFKSKEKIDGNAVETFHAVMPRQDDQLLPLLRDK